MDEAELDRRFAYHPPKDTKTKLAHESVREIMGGVAQAMNALLPDGLEKSLVVTSLEEAMMWANASIARNPDGVLDTRSGGTPGLRWCDIQEEHEAHLWNTSAPMSHMSEAMKRHPDTRRCPGR